MFRNGPIYTKLLKRFNDSLRGIGLDESNDVDSLCGGGVDVDGLEDLMLASYGIMKFLRQYLRYISCDFVEGLKVPDIYTAIHNAILITDPSKKGIPLAEEADRMENVSRAAYAWLKSFRILDKPNLLN